MGFTQCHKPPQKHKFCGCHKPSAHGRFLGLLRPSYCGEVVLPQCITVPTLDMCVIFFRRFSLCKPSFFASMVDQSLGVLIYSHLFFPDSPYHTAIHSDHHQKLLLSLLNPLFSLWGTPYARLKKQWSQWKSKANWSRLGMIPWILSRNIPSNPMKFHEQCSTRQRRPYQIPTKQNNQIPTKTLFSPYQICINSL